VTVSGIVSPFSLNPIVIDRSRGGAGGAFHRVRQRSRSAQFGYHGAI
jgi:hypothetical protein